MVETWVAALEAPSVLSADSEDLPKDYKDCKIEVFAKRAFEASLNALKASITASLETPSFGHKS